MKKEKKQTKIKEIKQDPKKITWEQYAELRRLRHLERVRAYNHSPEGREVINARRRERVASDPEFRERLRYYSAKFRESPKYRAQAEKRREAVKQRYHEKNGKELHRQYMEDPEIRERERARQRTEEFRAKRRAYQTSPEYREYRREYLRKKKEQEAQSPSHK
jgi:hypothetical protein